MSLKQPASAKDLGDNPNQPKRPKVDNDTADDATKTPPRLELMLQGGCFGGKPIYANEMSGIQGRMEGITKVAFTQKSIVTLSVSGEIQVWDRGAIEKSSRAGNDFAIEFHPSCTFKRKNEDFAMECHPTCTFKPKNEATKFVDVKSWKNGFAAITHDGRLYNFENHSNGLERVSGTLEDKAVVDVAAGLDFTLYLTKDGEVFVKGNFYRRYGLHDFEGQEYRSPTKIEFTQNAVIKQISAGSTHAAFVANDGQLFTIGFSGDGRLGINKQNNSNGVTKIFDTPQLVSTGPLAEKKPVLVACSEVQTVVVLEGAVFCVFGRRFDSLEIFELPNYSFAQIAVDGNKILLRTTCGLVYQWNAELAQCRAAAKLGKVKLLPKVHFLTKLGSLSGFFVERTAERTTLPPIGDLWRAIGKKHVSSADVTFVVENEYLGGNKEFLSRRCAHFKAMFSDEPSKKLFNFPNLNKTAFASALKYLSTDEIPEVDDLHNAVALWHVASVLAIKELEDVARPVVNAKLSRATALGVLATKPFDDAEKLCLSIVSKNWPSIATTKDLKKIDCPSTLTKILKLGVKAERSKGDHGKLRFKGRSYTPQHSESCVWSAPADDAEESPLIRVSLIDGTLEAREQILTHGSEYFRSVLKHGMKEATESTIDWSADVSKATFRRMRSFLSRGSFSTDGIELEDALNLYLLTHKIDLRPLKMKCFPVIEKLLTVENFADLHPYIETHEDLKEIFWRFAVSEWADVARAMENKKSSSTAEEAAQNKVPFLLGLIQRVAKKLHRA